MSSQAAEPPPSVPGVPPRGHIAEPGADFAREEAAAAAAAAAKEDRSGARPAAEHVRRDIRLAQAYAFVQLGDRWMARPAAPNPRTKYGAASRLFEQGADIFRCYGRWRFAGEAYAKAGEAERRANQPLVAGVSSILRESGFRGLYQVRLRSNPTLNTL
jgi:hypothetical protein